MKENNLIKINSTMNGTFVITDYASIDKRRVFLMIFIREAFHTDNLRGEIE